MVTRTSQARVMEAMIKMKKTDLKAFERAYAGQ
jgi:hypothetical protein